MRDSHDQLDRLVDSALATYADPGADSGLERRILNRIAAEAPPSPRRRWLAWIITAPVAAGLLGFAVLMGTRQFRAPSSIPPQTLKVRKPAAPGSESLAETRARGSEGRARRTSGPKGRADCGPITARLKSCPDTKPHPRRVLLAAKSAPLPKLEIYPTPQPLTPQEEALVNFAAHATQSEREALIAAQRQNDAPLSVAAIEIKPLESPAAGAD
ncbi:MAG TPA: hypothetical protein VF730_12670 [Terracidiphilus sp.]